LAISIIIFILIRQLTASMKMSNSSKDSQKWEHICMCTDLGNEGGSQSHPKVRALNRWWRKIILHQSATGDHCPRQCHSMWRSCCGGHLEEAYAVWLTDHLPQHIAVDTYSWPLMLRLLYSFVSGCCQYQDGWAQQLYTQYLLGWLTDGGCESLRSG
jgi:hypothetical protein